MKKDIHPSYRSVVFVDSSSDFKFLTRSTLHSKESIKWTDGKTYPLIRIEVSSASHPFYTGKKIFVDTAGRVEKFNRRYSKHTKGSSTDTAQKAVSSSPKSATTDKEQVSK